MTPDRRTPPAPASGSALPLVPIGVAAVFILIANVICIVLRVILPYPTNPWEAGIVSDAWRMLQGGTIYSVGTDHATHMYGPLVTVLLAQVFRFTGPDLLVGRLVSTVAGTAVVIILAKAFGRGDRLTIGVTAALVLAANTRTSNYFMETRPDLDSILFAVLALVFLYQGLEPAGKRPRLAFVLAGTALLWIAVLFKQTAVVFMFIPALAMLGCYRKVSFRNQLWAVAIPIVAVLGTFGAIRLFLPGLWHFMVAVPAQYHVSALRAGRMVVELVASLPLFLVALTHWLFTDAVETWQLPRARWLMAALICTVPTSIVAYAKVGGWPNSLIPALISVALFCAWRAPVAFALLRDAARPLSLRIVTGFVLAVMLFVQVYPNPGVLRLSELKEGHGVSERALVIEEARSLPGKVVSPDDPTIALMAKGYAGRTGVFEADAVRWDPARREAIVKEIESADYVIAMRHGLPGEIDLVTTALWGTGADVLAASGFTRIGFQTTSSPVYELWRRTKTPGVPR